MFSVPAVFTVISLLFQPFEPAVPAVTASITSGAVLSSLMLSAVALVLNPASLVQDPFTAVPVVSVLTIWAVVQTTGLLMLSVPLAPIGTSLVYHPVVPR